MRVTNLRTRGPSLQVVVDDGERKWLQSYEAIIAVQESDGTVILDSAYWNHSRTTSRFRMRFLGESLRETRRNIKRGYYRLENLNAG